jgi:diaminohydroxyphosphoribosylaminopyrimidine deaminase/5-amino-6-(5-phosphoribosylamino)uracil reductase
MLDVRAVPTQRQPHLVIVDSALRTPVTAKLFTINNIAAQATNMPTRGIFIYTNSDDLEKQITLEQLGATVVHLPSFETSDSESSDKVNLRLILQDLAKREINELHVEAGATLNGALISAGLVDEFLIYLAPKLLGIGRGLADFELLGDLSKATTIDFQSIEKVGPDLRILGRIPQRDCF